jgi:AcrR family transcriptional regulator
MSAKRDLLVQVALRLFAKHGFHATGIDKIVAEAGVARMTLYKYFKSKDDLIVAALRLRDEDFLIWITSYVEDHGGDAKARLLSTFDALEDWFRGKAFPAVGFWGCAFINAAGEFADHDHPAHREAAEHKRKVLGFLRELIEEAGYEDAEALAHEFLLLQEGAIATAQVSGDPTSAARAKRVAEKLLEHRERVS